MIFDFEKSVQFAVQCGISLDFQNLQKIYKIFKMAASIGLSDFTSDYRHLSLSYFMTIN